MQNLVWNGSKKEVNIGQQLIQYINMESKHKYAFWSFEYWQVSMFNTKTLYNQ
jgi:hypothetical protein